MSTDFVETLLECTDLDAMVQFFLDDVGLRIETISPADDPLEVVMSAPGSTIRLRRSDHDVAGHLIVRSSAADPGRARLTAPNGTLVEFATNSLDVVVPPAIPTLSVVHFTDSFGTGRAGMEYRDILPGRWGGRFIASNIRIAGGGDVPDYVHFHRIRFQMIFCARGWVDVVYEDQGDPIRLHAGDCVLQPPEIRHRVLHSSPGMEVVEIGCPAVHDTVVEHQITLPTPVVDRERNFGGQRFVQHVAGAAPRSPYLVEGLVSRDTGIGSATDGLAGAIVIEAASSTLGVSEAPGTWLTHDGEFVFIYVLAGSIELTVDDRGSMAAHPLKTRDAVAIPAGRRWSFSSWDDDLELLQVTMAADAVQIV